METFFSQLKNKIRMFFFRAYGWSVHQIKKKINNNIDGVLNLFLNYTMCTEEFSNRFLVNIWLESKIEKKILWKKKYFYENFKKIILYNSFLRELITTK